METTPNLGLPLLESDKEVSEEHHKINIFVKALDARLGEVAVTLSGLAAKGHDHEQGSINGLVEALAQLAAKDHGHKLADLLDVDVTDAPAGKILQKIGEKWGLGDPGYSAEQINHFLTQKASSDHQHGVEDVTNLAALLGEKANAQAVSQALNEKAAKSETLLLTKARVTEEGVFEVNKGTAEAPDWEEYKSGGAPVLMGMVFNYDGVSVPSGCEALGVDNRRVLSRAIHPTFWERIKDVALPEDDPRLVDGFFYGVGDGASTFTLPASKGQFVASLGGDRAAQGEFQADGVRQGDVKFGHTSAYVDGSGNNFPDGGVAAPIIEAGGANNTGSKVANTHMGVFGDASDTHPVNWALPVCIVMATGVDDEALLNALAISQQVSANASKIAVNESKIAELSYFESSEVSVPNKLTLIAHGLGTTPSRVEAYLICKTADGPFSQGSVVPWEFINHEDRAGLYADDLYLRLTSDGQMGVKGVNSTNLLYHVINNSKWKIKVFAKV